MVRFPFSSWVGLTLKMQADAQFAVNLSHISHVIHADTLPPKFSAGGAIRTTTDAINNTPLEGRRRTTSAHNHRQNAPYSVPASGNNNPTTNDANKSSPVHTYNASTDSLASSVETSGARSPPVLFSGSGVDEAQNHAEDFAAQRRSSLASIASVTTTSDERGSGRTSPPSSQHDARLDGGAINCGRAAIFHQPHSQQSSRVPLPQSLPQYASNRHQSQHHLPRQLAGTTHSAAAVAAAVAAAAQRRYSLSSAVMPASMSTMAHPPPRQRAVSTFVAGPAAFPYAREEVTRDSNGEVACRICGKRYKNSVCLNKHAWEHHQ